VDAKTAQDARREVAQMYGPAIAKAASIVPGTEQPPGNGYDGNEEWKPSPDGFTVYVPIGTKI
jgi:hypothetical protein